MNNDLISREALKEIIEEKVTYIDGDSVYKIIDLINNAPTVEYPFYQEAYQTGYEEGYAQGYIEGSTSADWKGGAE